MDLRVPVRRALPARQVLTTLTAACLLAGSLLAVGAQAAQSATPAASPAAPPVPVFPPTKPTGPARVQGSESTPETYTVSLRELGAVYPLQLRGVDGRSGVPFSVRADRVATGGKLRLIYSYSPALLSELSQVNVLVNDEVAASLPTPKDQAGKPLEAIVDIPPRLISDFNRLSIQLVGHYTLECEDPVHTSLWANVSNQSELTVDAQPIVLQNDLSLLPLPFFDRRDVRRLELPFVFANAPANDVLEAAGTMASWLGGLADYRGARFPVSSGVIPQEGSAIVFVTGGASLPGVPASRNAGPSVSMVANPNDPYGKLLVIAGRDAAELKTAARAVALGNPALSGDTATITRLDELVPRKPYDAPNWLRNDRPVQFGELAPIDSLSVTGYTPDLVRIPLRLPPDLFGWREKGIPMNIKYRYSPPPTEDRSAMSIDVGQQFIRSELLRPVTATKQSTEARDILARLLPDGTAEVERSMHLPLYQLPSQSQLQFHFVYATPGSDCQVTPPNNVRSAIQPDSTIDISGLQHFIAMPDLAAFGTAGYPFTRMADLSETAVVMPDNATETDMAAYLAMLGRFGAITGYPATDVRVVQAQDVGSVADRDLLVLGSGGNQSLLTEWEEYLPVTLDGESQTFNLSDMVYRTIPWLAPDQRSSAAPTRVKMAVQSNANDGLLYGFESPLTKGRSVVALNSPRSEGLTAATDVLVDAEAGVLDRVQGSLVVIRGDQVDSLAADQSYYVGRLDPITYVRWYFATRPLQLVGIGLLAAVLLATVLFLALRARARRRLGTNRPTEH